MLVALSLVLALAADAAAPAGYILTYTLPECVSMSAAGGVFEYATTVLPKGQCVDIQLVFGSFQRGIYVPCAEGKTPMIVAYPSFGCQGEPGFLHSTTSPGGCMNIGVEGSSTGITVDG